MERDGTKQNYTLRRKQFEICTSREHYVNILGSRRA
jgi:hypothetical protein